MPGDEGQEAPPGHADSESVGETPETGDDPVLELDEVLAALAHPRRRYLLYTLVSGEDDDSLRDLATKLAALEEDKPTADVTDGERQRVAASLYHAHVPKLVDLGVVEYDEETGVLSASANAHQVQTVLVGAGAELDQRQETHARTTECDEPDADPG